MFMQLVRESFADRATEGKLFVNGTFECYTLEDMDRKLEDAREPAFYFWASYLWTIRNTAYNFKYLLHEERDEAKRFNWKGFGYNEQGRLVIGGIA